MDSDIQYICSIIDKKIADNTKEITRKCNELFMVIETQNKLHGEFIANIEKIMVEINSFKSDDLKDK